MLSFSSVLPTVLFVMKIALIMNRIPIIARGVIISCNRITPAKTPIIGFNNEKKAIYSELIFLLNKKYLLFYSPNITRKVTISNGAISKEY